MGFGIKKEAGSNTTPSDIVNFDKLTPTTAGVVFTPNTPATLDTLYLSSVDASTWIWNGTAYITYSPPATATTEWYLLGTTIDAGSNKTAPISRNNSIYTQGSDSYFNGVRIGRGASSIVTNTVVGNGAGNTISTGFYNTFNGYQSGQNVSTGTRNSFFGYFSGHFNTTGQKNTFLGSSSGQENTIGEQNTFSGYYSGYFNTTGSYNTFSGVNSGFSNTTGDSNTFSGQDSGYLNTTGYNNSFFGEQSGYSNTANDNTFIGRASGLSNSVGTLNTFVGLSSGYSNTTASYNTFNGAASGFNNVTGTENTFIGYLSGFNNTTGEYNTFSGASSGRSNTTASYNTFIGNESGFSNTTGEQNTFSGYNSGYNNTIGLGNTFSGASSGRSNTTASYNTFIGNESGFSNTTGEQNTFSGYNSGYNNTIGLGNTFSGVNSGFSNTTGGDNVLLGTNSGRYISDGVTALTDINTSVFLGTGTKALANSQTNQIVIGYNAIGKGSNTVNIGNTSITNTYLNGAVTFNNAFTFPTTDGTANYFLKTNGSGTVTWSTISAGGLTYFTEAQSTASPNATVNVDSLTAVASTTDADFVIRPKGTGAILGAIPDNAVLGGNKRGANAVDLQTTRNQPTNVASGNYSTIVGGQWNTASAINSTAIGGYANSATGQYSTAIGFQSASAGGGSFAGGNASAGGGYDFAFGNVCVTTGTGGNVCMGYQNTITNGLASIAIGNGIIINGNGGGSYNHFAAGGNHRITAYQNSVALGNSTIDNGSSKMTYGSAGYVRGDAQSSKVVLLSRTTTNTPVVMVTSLPWGLTANSYNQFYLSNNNSIRFKGTIIGRQSGSTNTSAWDIDGIIQRGTSAATTTLILSNINVVQNTPSWGTPTITADTSLGCLTVSVTGVAATNIQWTCSLDTTEVIYA